MENNMYVNPFEDKNEVFQQLEFTRLFNSLVSVKDRADSRITKLMKFGEFILLAKSEKYENVMRNLRLMKGWKHSKELHKGKSKEDWFKDVKLYHTPQCILTSYVEDGGVVKSLNEVKNPYVIIDIDNIEVNEENLNKIHSLEFVMCTGVSVSGEGYYSIVRLPDSVKSKEDFTECFKWISNDFEDIGFTIDGQCKNINRTRVLSPYEIVLNDNYSEPYDFIPRTNVEKNKYKYSVPSDYCRKNLTSFITVPDKLKVYGCKGKEDYYREVNDLHLEFPTVDERGNEIEGRNFNILYSYANAIYRVLGEDGWELYKEYFPETPEKILKDCGWSSAKNWKGEVKRRIVAEIERLIEDSENED